MREERSSTSLPIREWIKEERPREALVLLGTEYLPLSKLFAVILRTGRKGVNAEELSRRLLNTFSGLRGLDAAPLSEICRIDGIGPAKAAQVKAALEIGKRLVREESKGTENIRNPRALLEYVAGYYGPYLRDSPVECVCLILLNHRCRPVRVLELGRGGPGEVPADPTRIVREALRASASSIVLVHNHPSGNAEPSGDDICLTNAVKESCELFGIRLLDHVIVGRDPRDYRSLAQEGLL